MKQPKDKLSILERGGLMIEALAMLGLIAVVTPTMYKKSAERTIEVDDINTSSTMRTIINAADSYVATNYGTIVGDMKTNGEDVRPIDISNLRDFLPYGFDLNKSLYNYKAPKLAIRRNGNSLTAFLLFPAKANKEDGLGQERTSRIASLIGANGGYVTDAGGNKSARGIGGIWKLDNTEFSNTFNGSNPDVYSIVTASSEPINGSAGGEVDNDKYLQRGKDDGDTTTWHNTMRTDLYMGNANDIDDDTIYKNNEYHNILGINQLIVGAKEVPAGRENDGLYIGNDLGLGKANAFIQGSLTAANAFFDVNANRLSYGTPNEWGGRPFYVENDGHAQMKQLTVDHDASIGYLGGKNGWKNIGLGYALAETTGSGSSQYVLNISQDYDRGIRKLDVMGDALRVEGRSDGLKKIEVLNLSPGSLGHDGRFDSTSSLYNSAPAFPVRVRSNMSVDGALAAGRLDTDIIRSTTLKVGSEKVDDVTHWLEVDKDGIKINDPSQINTPNAVGTQATFNSGGIKLTTTDNSGTDKAKLNLTDSKISAEGNTVYIAGNGAGNKDIKAGTVTLRSKQIQTALDDNVLSIGVAPLGNSGGIPGRPDLSPQYDKNTIRTEFDGGNVELKGANLVVRKEGTNGGKGNPVLEVLGNSGNYDGNWLSAAGGLYDAALYGNIGVYNNSGNLSSPSFEVIRSDTGATYNGYYIDYQRFGAVRILTPSENTRVDGKSIYRNIMVVDQEYKDGNLWGESVYDASQPVSETRKDVAGIDAGTLYIRKGYMELAPDAQSGFNNVGAYGPGAFVASRMVANNKDTNGNSTYQVPELHYTQAKYNGYYRQDDYENVRYDTYMVNPAYTSVMHDIKLTTRGGARLSDVLPDFINKGIYLVNNNYKDIHKNLNFYFDGYNVEIGGQEAQAAGGSTAANSAWASPYTGFVPAPQCPPGYGRVITLNPAGFRMGTVGNLVKAEGKRAGNYYVKNNNMTGVISDDTIALEYQQNNIKSDGGHIGGQLNFGILPSQKSSLSVDSITGLKTEGFVLTSKSKDAKIPVFFQQSDWLASRVIPLCYDKTSTIGGDECKKDNAYTSGWATVMGYLYRSGDYSAFFDEGKTNGGIPDKDGSSVYWNLFPVEYNTIEGYATVYCYFDRSNIYKENTGSYDKYVDTYSSINNITIDENKNRGENSEYLERLNDPTLKYKEVW